MKIIIDKWWKKGNRHIGLIYYPSWDRNHFKIWTNGAKRHTEDCCWEFQINFFKLNFTYDIFDFNRKYIERKEKERKQNEIIFK